MRYMLNQISNRDCQLLHHYRILRQPSDYLSPIYRDNVQTTQILSGERTSETFNDFELFRFDLGIDVPKDMIPYLEFEVKTASDFRNLQSLVYLENNSMYGFVQEFEQPVTISIYPANSLADIEDIIKQYLADLGILSDTLATLRDKLNKKAGSRESFWISGRDQNLIQFKKDGDSLAMEDSHYKLVTTLVGQTLLNPSQEVLSFIPKILSHDLLIQITDGRHRVLQGFRGFTIFVIGNGDWTFRDMKSTVNIASTAGNVDIKAFNCSLLYLRSNADITIASSKIEVESLFLHRTNAIVNDGIVKKLKAVGQSTAVTIGGAVQEVSYLGPGSTVDCMIRNADFRTKNLFGNLFAHGVTNDTSSSGLVFGSTVPSLSYKSGHRIGFLQGQTDFELLPSRVMSTDVNTIHIHDWSDIPASDDET